MFDDFLQVSGDKHKVNTAKSHLSEKQEYIDNTPESWKIVRNPQKKNYSTHLANFECFCKNAGPVWKAVSTTSEKLKEGVWVRLLNSREHSTSICIQWVQITPIIMVPNSPITHPAFRNASGIARIPVPILPFSRCTIVSKLLVGCSMFRLQIGSSSDTVYSKSTTALLPKCSASRRRCFSSLLVGFGIFCTVGTSC